MELFTKMAQELKKIIAAQATEYIKFFLKWGFVTPGRRGEIDAKDIARYMSAISKGALLAVLEERQQEEKTRAKYPSA